jgi:hypothetical protein
MLLEKLLPGLMDGTLGLEDQAIKIENNGFDSHRDLHLPPE